VTSLRPNNTLVAVAWLSTLTDLPVGGIATTLPRDPATWQTNGFVTVGPVVGGSPGVEMPTRHPVLQVQTWANGGQSAKPPWNKAEQLAEIILAGCQGAVRPHSSVVLTLPAAYSAARLLGAYGISEPRRLPSDVASYARYEVDIQIDWVPL